MLVTIRIKILSNEEITNCNSEISYSLEPVEGMLLYITWVFCKLSNAQEWVPGNDLSRRNEQNN